MVTRDGTFCLGKSPTPRSLGSQAARNVEVCSALKLSTRNPANLSIGRDLPSLVIDILQPELSRSVIPLEHTGNTLECSAGNELKVTHREPRNTNEGGPWGTMALVPYIPFALLVSASITSSWSMHYRIRMTVGPTAMFFICALWHVRNRNGKSNDQGQNSISASGRPVNEMLTDPA